MGPKKHKKYLSDSGEEESSLSQPIKLVLKVGSQESVPLDDASEERRHKHKKKKKKKSSDKEKERAKPEEEQTTTLKRPHEEDEIESDNDENEEDEDDDDDGDGDVEQEDQDMEGHSQMLDSDGSLSPSRRLRERTSCAVREDDNAILKALLNYLLKNLQNKDVNGFFAFPVTDSIAPGYSAIIKHPMDFSAMAAKIESHEYINVMDFKKDYLLMCNNAMTYNRPDTIYHKEAKRLIHLGIKQLSKEKLLHLKKTQGFLASITLQALGFDESGAVVEREKLAPEPGAAPVKEEDEVKVEPSFTPSVELEVQRAEVARLVPTGPEEDMTPDEILAVAQDAAQRAKKELTTRRPKTDLGFLRQEEDGTTSMTVLNPWNDGIVSSTQKVIGLGDYMGKLRQGSGSLFKFKEDKRNKVCPETYLCYGPFSSHAPTYDSSFSNCSKDESDLLLSTYGGEIGVQYAKSVQKFASDASHSAIEMVDKLLDTLTNGQHSKSIAMHEEQKKKDEELAEKSLQDEMIAFAEKAVQEAERKDPVQHKLDQTAAILSELSQTQKERLSQPPPSHLSYITQPSDKEASLADKLTDNLVTMAKQVYPGDVVSTGAVRSALGITTYPQTKSRVVMEDSDSGSEEDEGSEVEEEEEGRVSMDVSC